MRNNAIIIMFILVILGCQQKKEVQFTGREIDKVLGQMTEIMIHDVSNPPLAMRFYAYTCLAGYSVLSAKDSSLPKIQAHLFEFPSIQRANFEGAKLELVSILAMMDVSSKMQPSGQLMKNWKLRYMDSLGRVGLDEKVIDKSAQVAGIYAEAILKYAKSDGYNKISNFKRYSPVKVDGKWYPTPPGYFPAVEPYFFTIRNFTLMNSDNLNEVQIPHPIPFDSKPSSAFYQLAKSVYSAGKLTNEKQIAAFWDCNPFALSENGHLLIALKKVSPGAHWMGIAGIVCAQKKLKFNESLKIRTILSVGLMDAFWVCWKEKYHSNRIRPETAIRKLIDPTWKPFLQTPPFPEYPSGHSVVSSTAAVLLTHLLGENIAYRDTVETRFGIPAKDFTSFNQAAELASISRFYGGIHFMDGITNGQIQGKKIGYHIIKTLKL